jgi:hypothetical protein
VPELSARRRIGDTEVITAEYYEKATGHPPKDDDLERSNCKHAGMMGHHHCGWDYVCNLPEFIAVAERWRQIHGGRAAISQPMSHDTTSGTLPGNQEK